MRHYVKITRYMSGDSLATQLTKMINDGLFDEHLAVFFSKSNCITTEDIAYMMKYFDIEKDSDFSNDNVIFVPREWVVHKVANEKTISF